jgi:L-seryl-tRNA(Ser) seleniumtransferase
MLSAPAEALERRARTLAANLEVGVAETRSTIGGGSLPGQTQPSWAVALPASLAGTLRRASPPVIGRVERDQLLLDLRSVLPEQDALLESAVRAAR